MRCVRVTCDGSSGSNLPSSFVDAMDFPVDCDRVFSPESLPSLMSVGYSSTPTHNHSLLDNSSFLNVQPQLDLSCNQSTSLTDSGLEDSPYLLYRFGLLRSKFGSDCSPVPPKKNTYFLRSSVNRKVTTSDDSPTPPFVCDTHNQWTPELQTQEKRKRHLRKTYEELFPDSGVADVRCSSPVNGFQPPSPTFGGLAMDDVISYSPFAAGFNDLHSPTTNTSSGIHCGPGDDMYFTSSAREREPNTVSPQYKPSLSSSIDLIADAELACEASVPVLGNQESSLPPDEQNRIDHDRSYSSMDFENNIDNTRRSLFNKIAEKSGVLISSPCKPKLSVTDKLPKPKRKNSESESERNAQSTRIGSAMSQAAEEDLIGDFTRPYCLPRTDCKHHDLKSISSQTLIDISNGCYSDMITKYFIVDCRYPYEYDGGHILGAINIYTREQLLDKFFADDATVDQDINVYGRTVIIFHCEFSSERAPKLMRFMRNNDRAMNVDSYPLLRYPELYLLDGGYQSFHNQYGSVCCPSFGYTPMYDRQHSRDLRLFKTQVKSTVVEPRKCRTTWRATGKLF